MTNATEKYYAIIYSATGLAIDNEGPAMGVGTTPELAWKSANEAAPDFGHDDNYIVAEITRDSYNEILAGDPDFVEIA